MVKKVPLGKLLIEQKERIGTVNAGGLALLGVNNKVGLHRSTNNKIKDLSNYKIVQTNWFAYNPMRINVGSLGLALTEEQVGVISPDYVVFSCGENLSPDYLNRFLKSSTGMTKIRKNTTGTVRERLYFKSLAKIEIPLPSISEQTDISDKLQRLESIIQQTLDNNSQQLDAVNKLRQAILQLAVQGKLVPQDPKDEPASVLLEKIKTEKDWLIKEGKIKKSNPLAPIKSDEIPYELPNGWEWTQLSTIGLINPRNEISDETEVSFVPMKLVPTILGDRVESEIRQWGDIKKGFTHFSEGDVALAKITPCFQNKKSTVMRGLKNGSGAGTTELHIFRPINDLIISEYVLLYLKTPNFILEGMSKMTGSAGQKRVPKTYFSETPFPLPPTNEQKRIVDKVNELMALCDKLETSLSQSQTDCDRLMEAAVAEILAA